MHDLKTWEDVTNHARILAPMIGIAPQVYDKAAEKAGRKKTASAIFIMLQIGDRIRDFGAYFHSITLGKRAGEFDPVAQLRRLSRI